MHPNILSWIIATQSQQQQLLCEPGEHMRGNKAKKG